MFDFSKNKWKEVNEKYGEDICYKYINNDILLADLSGEYGCSSYIIRMVLNHNEIPLKDINTVNKEVNRRGRFKQRKYGLNHNYFKTWSSDMAYILGFIYADGYIGGNKLKIGLQKSDRCILETIKNKLDFEGEIKDVVVKSNQTKKEHDASILTIGSVDLVNDLRNIGLYTNKSLTIKFPKNIPSEFALDFIRGYMDGDGSVEVKRQEHKTKNSITFQLRVRFFSGSEDMVNSIQEILSWYDGIKNKRVYRENSGSLYSIAYSTKESIRLYELLYKESDIFLPRKKEKFELGFKLREKTPV